MTAVASQCNDIKSNGRPNPHAKLRQVQVSSRFRLCRRHRLAHALQQLIPESLGIDKGNRGDEVVAGGRKRRKEDQRKQELENDEYTEDVQPTSVRCRGCQKAISLDKRSRYYPGLWVKHRSKCPGILELEEDKALTRRRDWFFQLNPEPRPPTTSSFDASGENWEEGESDEDEDEG
ncbi:hypothetical protein DFJ58DRAFT_916566 [Suillus subalutaceus]|uniref:uncharacterized protein n=1 Tax=Suillus subalutaceus TaxID=48586 RepID=UPI001B873795|nr:uncharacterized protein DFJ58DRAFT_916566 [Suillus subalutaceus]KAG1841001.1 hypothetical protein DFJ58DRAFT_916566 [Suillus subalutaceus]